MDKKDLVKILLPDYIDGTAKMPPSYENSSGGIFNAFKLLAPEIYKIEVKKSELLNVPPKVASILQSMSNGPVEKTLRSFIRVWKGYTSNSKDNNNYIFSKNLTKAFSNSSLNIDCDNLPEIFHGYLDLKGVNCGEDYYNAELVGAFVSIQDKKLTVLAFGFLMSVVSPVYFQYDIESGKTLDEILFDLKEAPKFLRVVITAVMYVTYSPEDLIEQINEFPRSEKKATALKKHYTQRKCIIVGKYFTLPKQYSDEWITNRGHFAFRRVGIGRTGLKYTWISPSKPYQKGQGGNNGS